MPFYSKLPIVSHTIICSEEKRLHLRAYGYAVLGDEDVVRKTASPTSILLDTMLTLGVASPFYLACGRRHVID